MTVHFVVAGAQKSGTTTLHRMLSQHPGVHMAPVKGTHFFDSDSHFASGRVDYSAYHGWFSPGPRAPPCWSRSTRIDVRSPRR